MIHSYIELLKLNLHDAELKDVKNYTLVSTRPGLDIKQRISVNCFNNREYQLKDEWAGYDFSYDISEYGFRDVDLPNEIDFGIFGCSFTFGQGLPVDFLWHKIIANKLNVGTYNFGQPAAGIKSIVDIFLIISKFSILKNIIFLLPPYQRQLYAAENENHINFLPILPAYESDLEKNYLINSRGIFQNTPDIELLKRFKDELYLVDYICTTKNINMYCSSWDHKTYEILNHMNFNNCKILPEWTSSEVENYRDDLARDKMHPGQNHHNVWANKIIGNLI